jgi:hypothetical protein
MEAMTERNRDCNVVRGRTLRLLGLGKLVALTALVHSGVAQGQQPESDDKRSCAATHVVAQQMRQEGKFRAAREALILCSRSSCPSVLRAECGEWLTEVAKVTPTIVASARTKDGERTAVRISVDGEVYATRLDGKAIEVDPGEHKFRFETQGEHVVEQQIIVREGEKGRALSVFFGTAEDERLSRTPAPMASPPMWSAETWRTIGIITGGVGVIGLGTGTLFGLQSKATHNEATAAGCAGKTCPDEASASLERSAASKATVSTIAFAAGGALSAAGLMMILLAPSSKEKTTAGFSPTFTPVFGPHEMTMLISAEVR